MALNGLIDLDIIQQLATIQWARTGDSSTAVNIATVKLIQELWSRLCQGDESELEALRTETIAKISKYVKDNPNASKEQLSKFVGKEIEAFAKKVDEL